MATLKIGDTARSPRFPSKDIEVKFDNIEEAEEAGYNLWHGIFENGKLLGHVVIKHTGEYTADLKIALPW